MATRARVQMRYVEKGRGGVGGRQREWGTEGGRRRAKERVWEYWSCVSEDVFAIVKYVTSVDSGGSRIILKLRETEFSARTHTQEWCCPVGMVCFHL